MPIRIAVFAQVFPPVQSVGAQRPLRLANFLGEKGMEVTVYAGHPRAARHYHPIDPRSMEGIDPRVKVVRVRSMHPFKHLLAMRDERRGRSSPGPVAKPASGSGSVPATAPITQQAQADLASDDGLVGRLRRAAQGAIDFVMTVFNIPDQFSGWILTAFPAFCLRQIFRGHDVVYVTGPPFSSLVAAALVARMFRLPLLVDYRDPWNFNPYGNKPKRSANLALESWVLASSRHIIANTESMAHGLREMFPGSSGRIFSLYNGIPRKNIALYDSLRARTSGRGEFFLVSHVGTLYPERMTRKLAGLLAEIARDWKGSRDIRFRFIGKPTSDTHLMTEFARLGVRHKVEILGPVDSEAASLEQVRADALLLLQPGTLIQIPAKIFEYVLARRPVLCFAEPGSESGLLVEKYRLGLVRKDDADCREVLGFLEGVENGVEAAELENGAERFIADFDSDRLNQRMLDLVSELGGSGCRRD